MAKIIKLPAKKSKGKNVGRNFVRTPEEAKAFKRKVAKHHAKAAKMLLPQLEERVLKHGVKEITRIMKARTKSTNKDFNVSISEWIMGMDWFIINQIPIQASVKKTAHANRQHETRLTIAMSGSLVGKPVEKKTARVILDRAIKQIDKIGTKFKDSKLAKRKLTAEREKLKNAKGNTVALTQELFLITKTLNRYELELLLGKEYSDLYSTLHETTNKLLQATLKK